MNRFIPDEIIDEIRGKADIADVIGSYIQIKRAGSGKFKALCPFHNEKTPSFHINTDKQMFHCFGCGKGGDAFRFIMDKEGVDFPNAVHMLADKFNVIIPEPEQKNYQQSQSHSGTDISSGRIDKKKLYTLNEELTVFYENFLHSHPESPVTQYLTTRNLPLDVIKKFRIGAAPDEWTATVDTFNARGYTQTDLITAGAVIKKEETNRVYDRFRNRLIFPIWDEQGRVVGFSARTVETETNGAKYVNSPETPVFHKSRILYALPLAREGIKKTGYTVLCEGQLDVIAMHRAGYTNTVAPQGTAFTDEQARILKRYTEQILISFDSDDAGQKATLRAIEILLPVGFAVKILNMPDGSDPDSLFNKEGASGIEKVVESSIDFFEFTLNISEKQYDRTTPFGQSKIVETMLSYISKINNDIMRSSYASLLSQKLSIPQSAVFNELNRYRKNSYKSSRKMAANSNKNSNTPESVISVKPVNDIIINAEEMLLELALSHGTIGKQLAEQLPREMISDTPVGNALNEVIAMTLNGEWEDAEKTLKTKITQSPEPAITKILTSPSLHSEDQDKMHDMQEKALFDCLTKIKNFYTKIALEDIQQQIANASGKEKEDLMRIYQQKKQELLS